MKANLKIALLVWNLSTNDGFIRASLLKAALEKLGCKVEICGFVFGKGLYEAIPRDLNLFTVSGTDYPRFLARVVKFLNHLDADIIYAIKPQPASFGIGLLKKIFNRKPVILDIDDWEMSWHGGDSWSYHPTFKQLARDVLKTDGALRCPYHPMYLKWMEGLVSYADAVTVHSSFLQQRFGGISVPNGKDTVLFDPALYDAEQSRIRYGLSGYRILMFPGASRPYKGLEDVLLALEQINQPDLKLVIVGGSPYDDYDRELQRRWGRWLIKLPKYPADVMPDVVMAAHVVVVPQRDTPETRAQFPLKLTDGMALAKPVLATRVSDIPEILSDVGYLVDADCPEQLRVAILEIFGAWEAALERGRAARLRCIERYSIEAMAGVLESVIEELGVRK